MNTKALFPWIVVLVLIAGLGLLFSANRKQAAALARLENQGAGRTQLVSPDAGKAGNPSTADEATLRKDREDLLRLRNENRQLRDEKDQLTKQLQTSRQQLQQATPTAEQQAELQKAKAEIQQFRAQAAQAQQNIQVTTCVNNLRQIEGAKQQWALENGRPTGSVVGQQDVANYLPNKAFPTCPAGGAYTLNPVGLNPLCNIPGHVLPK
jgi:hypothetical protein